MPLILFNIGWMKHYRGQRASDRIFNGGKYVQENETGGEVKNFLPVDSYCYGYVQPPGKNHNIDLEKVGGDSNADYVDNVTVVFTATPPSGGRRVVGWFKNARVWRDEQRHRGRTYFARSETHNCTLLDIDDRIFYVPRSSPKRGIWGMGQRNVRYVRERDEEHEFIINLQEYIENPENVIIPDNPGGAPQQPDPDRRAQVELAAVQYVIAHYEGYNFQCESVEKDNKGWDLEVRRGVVELLVEVKGCSGASGQVELTPNEYSAMTNRRYREKYRLAIVTRALDDQHRRLSIVSYNGSDETWRDQDGHKVTMKERTGARIGLR